ncbi:MAG: hypothetical protein AAB627_00805 [Patescibacteria group bacterium]
MPELELLPEKTKRIEIGPRATFGPGVLALVTVLILYGGLLFYNQTLQSKIQELDASFIAFNQARDKTKENRVKEVKSKLEQTQVLLNEHVLWSEGFKKIQGLTLSSIQFQSLTASLPELKFEFRATAPNLTAIAKQGANFLADDSVQNMSISQIKVLTTGRVEFVIKLIFDKSKFLK